MKIIKSFVKRDIAGECVLIPVGDTSREFQGFFNLSETAAFLWDHIESANSLEELVALLRAEYEVDQETAYHDTLELLARLIGAGFIELTDPARDW